MVVISSSSAAHVYGATWFETNDDGEVKANVNNVQSPLFLLLL